MTFKPLSYLEGAVKNKDIAEIRIAILSYIKKCLGDTNEIEDAINYIKNSLSELEYNEIWEEHDGISLEKNKNNWNKNYFSSVEVDLSDNFSKERFKHILEVGKYVYGTTESVKPRVNKDASSSIKRREKDNKNFLLPLVVGGVMALIAIPAVIKLMKK